MKTQLRLLHLEDSAQDAELVRSVLKDQGFDCALLQVQGKADFERAVAEGQFDLVLSDFAVPGYDGLSALAHVRSAHPNLPFILVSGTVGEDEAIDSLKSGATDYVLKSRLVRLGPAVRRALKEAETLADRKKAEARIREQAALLDKAQDAICLEDLAQKILYWNKGAERLYGWTAREAVGRKANELLVTHDQSRSLDAYQQLIEHGEWKGEMRQLDRNGAEVVVESRWTLMRDEAGRPTSVLLINTDVTEKKLTEAKFLRTQRMENIGALAGGIAHDLNNALAPVLMAADLLECEMTTPGGRKMLQMMRRSARRGSEMVKQILAFARGVGGEHTLLMADRLIADMESLVKGTFPPSISIEKRVAKDLQPVRGDATQLHQVLMNLCVNARDAMPDGGRLTIEAVNIEVDENFDRRQSTGPHVRLTVADTGQGIPPENLQKIFEPFFTTKECGKGTGLGLSTVMGIVKTHGGFLEVSSEVGKGTDFRIYLPASAPFRQLDERPPAALPHGSGETILLVDDELAILEMTKLNLEAHDYRVLTANEGAQALELFRQRRDEIKVVVTDMLMPNMNGVELIKLLRKVDPSVKIVAASGEDSEERLSREARPLAQEFLTKPFSTETMLVTLRDVLSPQPASQPAVEALATA